MAVESDLEKLHPESFMWALACCDWNRGDAEDILQTAYLKIYDGRARFDARSSFKTWLFSVIRLTASESRRRRTLRGVLLIKWWQSTDALAEKAETPQESLTISAEKKRLNSALAQLPRRQREILELVFYHDMTIAEAAASMDVGVGTARTHYERGKRELRRLLTLAKGVSDK